jgi:hypothetical protein
MKKLGIVALSFVITTAIIYVVRHSEKPEARNPNIFPVYANCANPQEGTLEIESEALVNERFYEALNLKENPKEVALAQLRHLRAQYFYNEIAHDQIYVREVKKVEVRDVSKASLPKDIIFDDDRNVLVTFKPQELPFTFKKGSPAYKVSYKAQVDAVLCGGLDFDDLRPILPIEPYLTYWSLKPSQRLEMTDTRNKAVLNPCSSWRMVYENKPEHHWYFYRPRRKGKSTSGEKFDCTQLLVEGEDVLYPDYDFVANSKTQKPIDYSQLISKDVIKVDFIYGLINGGDRFKVYQQVKSILAKELKRIPENERQLLARSKKFESVKQEATSRSVYQLFYHLNQVMNLKEPKINEQDKSIVIHTEGEFKKSKKKLKLRVFYGITDAYTGELPHAKFTYDSLENADLIFYVAHSGHGLNFDFKKIMNELKMSEAEFQKGINKNPYQMLGIISCFSSTDHFNEYFNYRDDSNTSDLIIMDTEGYPYLSPISFVRYLDDLISKEAKASSLGAYLRKYSDRESLSIHRE